MFDSSAELLAKIRLGEDSLLELKAVYFRGNHVEFSRDDITDESVAAFFHVVTAPDLTRDGRSGSR